MEFRIWLVLPDYARARRWHELVRRCGWPVALPADAAGLAREAAASPGLALVDAGALGARPAAFVRDFKLKVRAVPLILISAAPLDDETVIAVLDAGADDYFTDGLDGRLTLAKLNAHLRRALPALAGALDTVMAPGGDMKLDRSGRSVLTKAGAGRWVVASSLTPTEAKMLSLLLENPGTVLERRFLLETVWQAEAEAVQPGTVDKHIESLRRKLGAKGGRIKTVYGSGYVFREGKR